MPRARVRVPKKVRHLQFDSPVGRENLDTRTRVPGCAHQGIPDEVGGWSLSSHFLRNTLMCVAASIGLAIGANRSHRGAGGATNEVDRTMPRRPAGRPDASLIATGPENDSATIAYGRAGAWDWTRSVS